MITIEPKFHEYDLEIVGERFYLDLNCSPDIPVSTANIGEDIIIAFTALFFFPIPITHIYPPKKKGAMS